MAGGGSDTHPLVLLATKQLHWFYQLGHSKRKGYDLCSSGNAPQGCWDKLYCKIYQKKKILSPWAHLTTLTGPLYLL